MSQRPAVLPADEGAHAPGPEQLWSESWYFDFFDEAGTIGGWVRLGLYPNLGCAWYHAYVVRPGRPTVVVADLDVPLPKPGSLEIRGAGLWAEHIATHPLEVFQVANEAHGVAIDEPVEAYRPGGPRGDLVPMGLDLDYESDGEAFHYGHTTRYELPCKVHGEILLGDERIPFDGWGQRDHSWAVRDWWQFGWMWTAGRLTDGLRFHGVDVRAPGLRAGFAYHQRDGAVISEAPDPIDAVPSHEETDDEGFVHVGCAPILGLEVTMRPVAWAPSLLVGPEGQVSRFPRALCAVTTDDDRTGWCWTEWNQPR